MIPGQVRGGEEGDPLPCAAEAAKGATPKDSSVITGGDRDYFAKREP